MIDDSLISPLGPLVVFAAGLAIGLFGRLIRHNRKDS